MTALETLKHLKIEASKKQYPGLVEEMKYKLNPETAYEEYFGKVLTRYKPNSTNGLTKCIEDYINLLDGGMAERIANQGTAKVDKIKRASGSEFISNVTYIPSQGRNGRADITASYRIKGTKFAVRVEIEVKYGKDRMSEAQKKYKAECESKGVIYIIAKDFEQFFTDFNKIFNINH